MKVLEIKDLLKRFQDLVAVDNINLSVNEGEIYGLLGPNGAGKSTIINLICGLLRKDKGQILVLGKDSIKEQNFVKKNIGIVPQDIAIYMELTAYENVSFFGSLYGLRGKELKEKSMEALRFVGLEDKAKEYPKKFSGGMKRRLNIACAIVHTPKLIIMDEPTVGIDPQSRNHILNSIRKLNGDGCTIIYTTHYMEEVEALCSKAAIIDHGKVIAEGTLEDLKTLVTDVSTVNIGIDDTSNCNEEEIKAIKGVLDVSIDESLVSISSKKEVNNLDKLIGYFINNNIKILSVETKAPNLETVFLSLTGRKLRD
ncbi:ABC transporter ATP-binding protein [Clostridium hydrogeniformans]|uniref:ABC transporter ATP-binding protein n=1 Tax=Clostridium hydrogeniformans TaxID=349933 RepID=UPI0004864DE8|nr:ABC transporter ATP-binding protein [Clostridium hydrogeniformans]